MKTIVPVGYEKPTSVTAGPLPLLQWLSISDLLTDPSYRPPITRRGRRIVNRIANSFSWSRFATVLVAPAEDNKFVIIDGERRTTAAALLGFEKVPCQIVAAARAEQAIAFKVINKGATAVSRMALHATGVDAGDPWAARLVEVCARAEVELLRYPVPIDRQAAGQTMAVGAISQCLKRYGEETLITALQCVTQTANNKPGALSARTIKALCAVLGNDPALRDSGLALLETFDRIDLMSLGNGSRTGATDEKDNLAQAMADSIRLEISRLAARKAPTYVSVKATLETSRKSQPVFAPQSRRPVSAKVVRVVQKS